MEAVKQEIRLGLTRGLTTDSIYFGGGTPSLLDPGDIESILLRVHGMCKVLPESEITLEINPGTVTQQYLNAVHALGINRLNIGVQSFRDEKLAFLGRIHRVKETIRTLEAAMDTGFVNLGLDLIYGLPDESVAQWLLELEDIFRFRPQHLSCYLLTYEPGTRMHSQRFANEFKALDQATVSELFNATSVYLKEHGFVHYEISNFAAGRRFRSRHNSKYWNRTPYFGFGPSAHSFDGKTRSWNVDDVKNYVSTVKKSILPVKERELLTREQELAELIMLGFRTSEGIDIASFDAGSNKPFLELFGSMVNTMENNSWAKVTCGRFVLTLAGRTRLDAITSLFAEKIFMRQ